MMNKILFLLVTSVCFGQSYNCFNGNLDEIISNKLELKHVKYKQQNHNRIRSYNIDNKVKISLSNQSSFLKLPKSKKITFSQMTKEKRNISLNLEDAFYLKFKKEIFYIFEFRTFNQGIGSNTYNLIYSDSKKRILFKQWNSSGNGISNAFGVRKSNLFLLNQIRDSINYYELRNDRIIYQAENSSNIKTDSLGQICVRQDYKF